MFYRLFHVRETSPGTHTFFPSMSPPFLLCRIPRSYWTLACLAALSSVFSLKWFLCVGAEVCLHLPSALLNLTARTLVFSYILPTAGWIRDFHPLERAPAGRTKKVQTERFPLSHLHLLVFLLTELHIVYILPLIFYKTPHRSHPHTSQRPDKYP